MAFKPHDRNVTHGWAPKSEPGKEAGPKACAACRGPMTPPGEALQAHWPRLGAAGPGVGPASASVGVLRGGPRPSREPDSHPGGVGSTCEDRLAHKLGPGANLAASALGLDAHAELAQLALIDRRRSTCERVHAAGGLGERDHVADR